MICPLRSAVVFALGLLIAACGGSPILPDSPPEAPGSFTAELTPANEALLGWTAPVPSTDRAPVTGYRVYLESAGGELSALGDTLSLSYRHGGLSPGLRYVFHVRAVSDSGLSEPSASAFVDVPTILPPEAPGSFTAELTPSNEALLGWTAPVPSSDRAPVTGYRVYLESAGGELSTLGDTPSLSYRHGGLSPGLRYVFHVRAVSDSGLSEPSASAFVDVPTILPPEAPGSFTAELTPSNEALLGWTAPVPSSDRAPVTGYRVYREFAGGLAIQIGSTVSLSYRDVSILPGRTYVYHVRADSDVGGSLPSASDSVEVVGGPIAPIAVPHVSVRADQGNQRVVISWIHRLAPELSTVAEGFELQYCDVPPDHQTDHCPPNGVWTDLRVFPSTTRDFADTSLDCDPMARMYRMRAIASDPSASSRYSVPTRPICPSTQYSPPRRVEALFAETTYDSRVNVCWDVPEDNNSEVVGYELQVTTDRSLPTVEDGWLILDAHVVPTGPEPDQECRLYSGLAEDDERWFRVRAYNLAGHGHWSAPYHYVHEASVVPRSSSRLTVQGQSVLAVADAQVDEGPGATLAFAVTLSRAASNPVTVDYATADGTATAGQDYETASGTLVFAPGETQDLVHVTVLDDAHDEGDETLTLYLSNPSGAAAADTEATGTIVNHDPLPGAWLSRFGRTVGSQVVEAVSARLDGMPSSHATAGEVQLASLRGRDTGGTWKHEDPRSMTIRELPLGSAFYLSSGQSGGPALSAWGRATTGGVEGKMDAVRLDGDIATGLLGFDVEAARTLAGVAISMSEGSGKYQPISESGPVPRRGDIESSLVGVYPYASFRMSERVSLWGLAGYGTGGLTLTSDDAQPIETDIELRMGALGLRGTLLDAAQSNGVGLAVKSDAMWLRTQSDAVEGMERAEADVNRLRLVLEGSRALALEGVGTLTPSVELGVRHDGGDAETGTGFEIGAGVRYAAGGFSIEGAVRGLLAHQEHSFEEWGASGSIRIDPGASGRGLSLTLDPAWGNASNGVERLWSSRYAGELTPHETPIAAESRLDTEVGYGLRAPVGGGVMTPYTGFSLMNGGAHTVRLGTRWDMGPGANLSAEGSRRVENEDGAPVDTIVLRAALRW